MKDSVKPCPLENFRFTSLLAKLLVILFFGVTTQLFAGDPVVEGYRDFQYAVNVGVNEQVTAEKPESKLWWNDGFWWACMWNNAGNAYHIYQLNEATQDWIDTGTEIDDRLDSKGDALWDEQSQKLYYASHIWTSNASSASVGDRGELFRYSYNAVSNSYSLDNGFPVEINEAKSEALVIAKDSQGTLWATWVQSSDVMISHTLNGDDSDWVTPYQLPIGSDADVTSDDISAITSFEGKTGIMWSNQNTKKTYFAIHDDGADSDAWSHGVAYSESSDDHLNFSLTCGVGGNLYAVIKTSKNAKLIVLLALEAGQDPLVESNWVNYEVYGDVSVKPTRPILLVDSDNNKIYVFTRISIDTQTQIYYKSTDADNISFDSGSDGTPFIVSNSDTKINDPTSTKQCINSTTGMVVLASDRTSRYYVHNFMSLGTPTPPVIATFSPGSGPIGTTVSIQGENFSGITSVTFNGTSAGFTVNSASEIEATVPPGATTGKIAVTNGAGTAVSISDFSVTIPQTFTLTETIFGNGSVDLNPSGGVYNENTVITLTAIPDPGWQFDGWSGDLSGAINPVTLTMDADKFVTATFSEVPANQFTLTVSTTGQGSVTLNPAGGVYDAGTVVTVEALPDAGWLFNDWSGDLSGNNTPATITVDANKAITANFILDGGGSGGPVVHVETQTGSSASSGSVSTSGSLSGVSGDLYLASVSTRKNISVASVSGLGLSWSLVKTQCAGRNQTGVEVWMAIGSPTGDGTVSATFTGSPINAAIAVSRYTGVNSLNPIGSTISGNTNGIDTGGTGGDCSGGSDNSAYSFDLFASAGGGMIHGAVARRNRKHILSAGSSELANVTTGSGGDVVGMNVTNKPIASAGNIAFDGSFNKAVDWAAIGVEILPGGGSTTQHLLSITNQGNGHVDLSPAGGIYDAGTVVQSTPVADPGWAFSGWSGDLSGAANPAFVTMDADKNITAIFVQNPPQQFVLTTTTVGNGTVTLNPAGGAYDENTIVTLTATPDPGWQFDGWSGDLNGITNPVTLTMDANKSVTATFSQVPANQFTLTAVTAGQGSVTLNPAGGAYDAGTVVTLEATPTAGWQFDGWSGDLSGTTNPATLTMDANKTVTATFSEIPVNQFTLTVTTAGQGSVTLSPAGGVYDAGTVVTVEAIADAGWFFSGWSGDLNGSVNPGTITMDANKSITANFSEDGGGSGTVVFEDVVSGTASSSSTVSTSANVIAANNHLYIAAISSRKNLAVISVSGLGLTWALVKTQCAGRNQTVVSVWKAIGLPVADGIVTATFTASVDNAVIAVTRYSGVNTSTPVGNIVSGNTNGVDGDCSGGTDSDLYAFDLTASSGAIAYNAVALRNKKHTPGAGFTERYEGSQGSGGAVAGMAVQDQSIISAGTISINGNISRTVDWAVVGLEILPASTTGKVMAMGKIGRINPTLKGVSGTLAIPENFEMKPNYPNPFNPETTIEYGLPENANVRMIIYNILGQQIRELVNQFQPAGFHQVRWNGRDDVGASVGSGIYFLRITAGQQTRMQRLILQK